MATLSVVPLVLATPVDDSSMTNVTVGGDTFPNDGLTFLFFKNGATASTTVTVGSFTTVVTPPGFGAIAFTDAAIAIASGGTKLIGPFGPSRFNNGSGQVSLTYANAGTLQVKVVRFTPIA